MPTYEYACRDCGTHLEVVQSFSDDPLTTCTNCGGSLRKVFSAVGITFKGSGFYKTDSRKGSSTTTAAPASPSGEGTGSSSSGDGASSPASSPAPAAASTGSSASGGEAKSA